MKEYDSVKMENEQAEEGFDFHIILDNLRTYWWLFALSVIVCVAGAFVYLRYATPVYNVSAKVLLQDSQKGGTVLSPDDMLVDFGMQSRESNEENEMAVMSSMTVVRRAVMDAELYTRYRWGEDSLLRKETTPFLVAFDDETMSKLPMAIKVDFTIAGNGDITAVYELKEVPSPAVAVTGLPFVLSTPVGDLHISRNADAELAAGTVTAWVSPISAVATSYQGALAISPLSKTASVATLSYNTPDPVEGAKFLNAIIESYNKEVNDTKRQVACRTEEFISERLASVKKELEDMEGSLAAYKKQNELVDPKLSASEVVAKRTEYAKLLENMDLKLAAVKQMSDFVNDPNNEMQVLPAAFGVNLDQALLSLVNNYNTRVLERKTLLLTTTE